MHFCFPAALVFAPVKFPVPHVGWLWLVAAADRGRLVARAPRPASSSCRSRGTLPRHVDRIDAHRGARRARSTRGQRDDRARPRRHDQPLGPLSVRAVDGGAAVRVARVLSRSGPAARAHGRDASCSSRRRRCPSTSPCPARASPSRSATRRVWSGICSLTASRMTPPGTTACTTASACCTPIRPPTRNRCRHTCRITGQAPVNSSPAGAAGGSLARAAVWPRSPRSPCSLAARPNVEDTWPDCDPPTKMSCSLPEELHIHEKPSLGAGSGDRRHRAP